MAFQNFIPNNHKDITIICVKNVVHYTVYVEKKNRQTIYFISIINSKHKLKLVLKNLKPLFKVHRKTYL